MPVVQYRSLDLLTSSPAHYHCTTDTPIHYISKTIVKTVNLSTESTWSHTTDFVHLYKPEHYNNIHDHISYKLQHFLTILKRVRQECLIRLILYWLPRLVWLHEAWTHSSSLLCWWFSPWPHCGCRPGWRPTTSPGCPWCGCRSGRSSWDWDYRPRPGMMPRPTRC